MPGVSVRFPIVFASETLVRLTFMVDPGAHSSVATWASILSALLSALAATLGVFIAWNALKIGKSQAKAAQESVETSHAAIHEQSRSESQTRNLQTLLHCGTRYQFIEETRLKFRYAPRSLRFQFAGRAGALYRNYWTLKSDQLDYWLSGYVDHDSFLTWNMSTLRHLMKNDDEDLPFFVYSLAAGWAHDGRPYHVEINPLFVRFTDALYCLAKQSDTITHETVLTVLDMIGELVELNEQRDEHGRITRRYGAPESFESYRQDLIDIQCKMSSVLMRVLPDDYDVRGFGEKLKATHHLPTDSAGKLRQIASKMLKKYHHGRTQAGLV